MAQFELSWAVRGASATAHNHAVQYVRDSLTLLFLSQPGRARRYLAVCGAYWDESGTQENDPWLTVAGFVSTADGWVDFTNEWLNVLKHFELATFHANRFNARVAEYQGWSHDEAVECSVRLTDAILRYAVGSVGISVPGPALRKQIPPSLKGRVGDPYAIASRLCMVEAAGLLRGNLGIEGDVYLNHMFAVGAMGHGQLEMVSRYESSRPERVEHLALGSVAFGGQPEYPPLQAADFLAWELNRRTRHEREPNPPVMRMSLQRFSELPRRWFRLDEDHVGAQMLMALAVDWNQSASTRGSRRRGRSQKLLSGSIDERPA